MSSQVDVMLRLYYNKYKELDNKGGPEEDGDLFEEVTGLEEEILEKFGLPASNKNKEILWKLTRKKKLTDKYVMSTKEQLDAAAKKHLLAPVLSDLEQLTEAKAKKRSSYDVLPELGQPTHDYTIFLYQEVLGAVSAEDVLSEFSVLKRLDCYGDVYTLKYKHPHTFRRTKVYKQLKPYLKFLDCYLDPESLDSLLFSREEGEVRYSKALTLFDSFIDEEVRGENKQADLFSLNQPEPVDFNPEYITLTDLVEIEEIIFSEDSAVTVIGQLYEVNNHSPISLGFDFDKLTEVIQAYREKGYNVLSYFNKSRQLNAIDYPVIINLRDKTGSTLLLDQHFFKVYKPLTLGRDGNPVPMQEAFYIVDEVIDKARYEQQQVIEIRSALNATFHRLRNHYYTYLNSIREGMSEAEARRDNGLEDYTSFEAAKMLYLLEKHGGKVEIIKP